MGLPGALVINLLEINNSSRGPIMLRRNMHSAAPSCGGINRYSFQDPEANIPVKTSFDLGLPMSRNRCRAMHSYRCCLFVNKKPEWWSILHKGEGLMFTRVERAGSVPVKDVLA